MMDWFNTQFYRDYGYGLIYPQIFAHHKRPTDEVQAGTIAWGKEKAQSWFKILNDYWIGPEKHTCAATRSPSPTTSALPGHAGRGHRLRLRRLSRTSSAG